VTAAGSRRRAGFDRFAARYLRIDPRSAGAFRIALALLCIADTARHWGAAGLLYTNSGVLANQTSLVRPLSGPSFSIFHAFSTTNEVHLLFAVGIAVQLFLLVGHHSRWAAVLNLLFITSRDSRVLFVENGGYIVQNLACFWACFLPIERRFSVDALRASWRANKETTIAELGDRSREAAVRAPHVSLVGLAAVTNLAIVYFFNVLNKTGNIWRDGDTIHYVLHINRMATGLAVLVREQVPPLVLRLTDFTVIAVEATICVCIMSPRARFATRLLAIALICGLHLTLGVFMRLGPFSWYLIGWSTLLLLPVHFDRLHRFYERRSQPANVEVLATSPLAMAIARVVKRLDHRARVRFTPASSDALLALRTTSALVTDPSEVLRGICEALPFGRWLGMLVPARLFAWSLAHPTQVERFFAIDLAPRHASTEPAGVTRRLQRVRAGLREVALAWVILCATVQAWIDNKIIPATLPPKLKEGQTLMPDEAQAFAFVKRVLGDTVIPLKPARTPAFLTYTNGYLRIFQGWGMFAPNPIQEDGVMVVDAITVDGRHIDPITGRTPDLDLTDSRGEALSQIEQDLGNRLRFDKNQVYRAGVRDYALGHHLRTKNPDDEIVSVDIYWVRCKLPKPGEQRPTENDAVPIYTWRKPGYVGRDGVLALPPPLRTRSADKR
jgi:uncharacterized MAPEG superfamily protein